VGAQAFVGGGSAVAMDVAPFCRAAGNRARVRGLNHVGLRRRGFSEADMRAIRRAYRLTFHANLLVQEAAARIDQELVPQCPALREFTAFLRSSERGLTR
jgi:UDP-N-acetylglucosamine acyltransferase